MSIPNTDIFTLGGRNLHSRLFIGTGKYGADSLIPAVAEASGAEVITVALRRVDLGNPQGSVMAHIPSTMQLLPNTSGARTAEEAIRIARLARAAGCGTWIKIEVISDTRHLLPDGYATAKATEVLAAEGFVVLPYMNPDLYVARDLVNAGAAAVMPLGAPIGTNRGLATKEMLAILIEEIPLPIIVDAGLGRPSQACEAMEMGAAACLVNTAIATASDPVLMAKAFGEAIASGRQAFLAGLGRVFMRRIFPATDIYAITDSTLSLGRSAVQVVEALLQAKVGIIQYREKEKYAGEMLEECRQIRAMTRAAGAFFIVNDHVDIAALVDADGVHVGQKDLPLAAVRQIMGNDCVVGLSTHSPEQAAQAVAQGADYIGVGPIFATKTKKDVCDPVASWGTGYSEPCCRSAGRYAGSQKCLAPQVGLMAPKAAYPVYPLVNG
ncbi:hypothetical protein B566_EDAN018612 [Ephemera danica]|nr:hypothetical protein B566_EDAN018612 [Ephemera danica]